MPQTFESLSRKLDAARATLRNFTLGKRGSTQSEGVKAIDQVERLCGRLQEEFGAGSQAGAVTNGPARRLATAMQWRMPKVMGSLGAKTKLPAVTSAAAPATMPSLRQKARTLSPLR